MTFVLLADGTEVDRAVLSGTGNVWSASFNDLPVYKDGRKIVYSVGELSVPDYNSTVTNSSLGNYTITNSRVVEFTSVNVTKVWNDNDNQDGVRPASVIVELFADGVKVNEATLNESNKWKFVFVDLAKFKSGELINYTVSEVTVANYTVDIVVEGKGNWTVNNTHIPALTNINVIKVWDDADNQDGIRPPSVTVYLVADGVDVASATLSADDDWKYTFSELPVNKDGKAINYTVREVLVDGYLEANITGNAVDGYVIENPHVPAVTNVSVSKVWNDSDDMDHIRPVSITVELLADGEVIKTATLSEDNDWKFVFSDLPVNKDGKAISYTIKELSVDSYAVDITCENNTFVITNTHVHIYNPSMSVRKISLNKTVYLGEQVGFIIVVSNTGDCDLTGVYVIDNDFTEGIVLNNMVPNGDWTFDGKDKFTYGKTLGVGESANFTVIFNTTSVGFKINNVTAGNNITNETVNSTNNTTVVNKTVPPEPEPPEPEPPVPVPPQPVPPSPEVPSVPSKEIPDKHATGNPIFVLLLVLFTLSVNISRRKKQ